MDQKVLTWSNSLCSFLHLMFHVYISLIHLVFESGFASGIKMWHCQMKMLFWLTWTIYVLRMAVPCRIREWFYYFLRCEAKHNEDGQSIDDYAKDGGLGEVWILCSFYHEPLRTWIKTNVNKFAISNHAALKLGKQALKSYLKITC